MMPRRLSSLPLIIAVTCGSAVIGGPARVAAAPVQTCTLWNNRGFPISGTICGGARGLACTAGAIYRCRSSSQQFGQNNCTLQQACTIGCRTGPTTGNLNDACFTGSPPLTLSTNSTLGGNDVAMTVTLAVSHPTLAYVNLRIDRGDLVPGSYCGVPNLDANATSVTFALPTAVVSAPSAVSIYVNIAYTDTSGVSRQLVSIPSTLTLNPGGTEPPAPPIADVILTPSTIGPGQVSIMDVELSRMAPARGIPISASSSNPSVASVIANAQPVVLGGCIYGGGAATIQAASAVPGPTTVTISASSGAADQPSFTHLLTVTPGCDPASCLGVRGGTVHGGPCGALPDGCGGAITCGCDFGETCGGAGVPGECAIAPMVSVSGLSLNPTSVAGGSSSTGTVTLNMASPPGGAAVFLSSSGAAASVPSSVVIPQGQTAATFAVTTSAVQVSTFLTISASLAGTVTAVLTVNPGTVCTPTTCTAQGKNCGTIANGCGGTLSCGSCTAPQTCGGGGVPNVCGGAACTPTTCAAQGKNCGTISDGCGGTLSCGACIAPQTCGGGGVANVCGGGSASTSQLTVSATGRSGESVSSSPAGLKVNVGTTGSASFTTGTSITLSVSNGRDAIWSGGCSSGGSKTKSCTLTLSAAASVTANVQ